MLREQFVRKCLPGEITAQDKTAVVRNIILPEAEKQVLGFKVSDLDDAINLSVKPPAVAGQRQFRFIQRQELQSLYIIEIQEAIKRLLLGVRKNTEELIFIGHP